MPLGEFSIICFEFLRIFLRKIAKKKENGNLGKTCPFAAAKGCLAAARPRAKKATPRVRCSIAVLRRDEDTVHRGKISDFDSKSLVFVHRLFRNHNKLSMGVQIRMKLSEKRTVPHRRGEANFGQT